MGAARYFKFIRSSQYRSAAVGTQALAGEEAGSGAGEEEDGGGDLRRAADAGQGVAASFAEMRQVFAGDQNGPPHIHGEMPVDVTGGEGCRSHSADDVGLISKITRNDAGAGHY